jgi:hypothetical protein
MKSIQLALALVMPLFCLASLAADEAKLDSTQIIGNRELPKVLYIVPWQKPQTGELVGRPVASLLDETLAPIDREVFRRQIHYHRALKGIAPAPTLAAATPRPATK